MSYPTREIIETVRKKYPAGSRVELVEMRDAYTSLPPGIRGTVIFVDDLATVHVDWDNGSDLGVVYGEDKIKAVEDLYNDQISLF